MCGILDCAAAPKLRKRTCPAYVPTTKVLNPEAYNYCLFVRTLTRMRNAPQWSIRAIHPLTMRMRRQASLPFSPEMSKCLLGWPLQITILARAWLCINPRILGRLQEVAQYRGFGKQLLLQSQYVLSSSYWWLHRSNSPSTGKATGLGWAVHCLRSSDLLCLIKIWLCLS